MNGQVTATISGNGNGGAPGRTSPGDDDGAVVVEPAAVEAVVEVAS